MILSFVKVSWWMEECDCHLQTNMRNYGLLPNNKRIISHLNSTSSWAYKTFYHIFLLGTHYHILLIFLSKHITTYLFNYLYNFQSLYNSALIFILLSYVSCKILFSVACWLSCVYCSIFCFYLYIYFVIKKKCKILFSKLRIALFLASQFRPKALLKYATISDLQKISTQFKGSNIFNKKKKVSHTFQNIQPTWYNSPS